MTALALPQNLAAWMAENGVTCAHIARGVGVNRVVISRIVNHNRWPTYMRVRLHDQLITWLAENGLPPDQEKAPERSNAPRPSVTPTEEAEGDENMVLRKTRINEAARRHFNIARDPFADPQHVDDVFLSPMYRYVRESVMDKAKHGGMLAVIGQSGSGKSTMRGAVIEQLREDHTPCIVIEPYVIAMAESDATGVPLRAQHSASAIWREVSPASRLSGDTETRFAQLHRALRESARAGNRHLIVIEEAHSVPKPTLRHLRRFTELRDGLRSLIGVVLFGQQELEAKLSESDPQVREVVQRTELVHVYPLGKDLEPYLRHRFQRAGLVLDTLIDAKALDAITARLAETGTQSLLYPQAVHNLVAMCLNAAAELGAPGVSADLVRRV